MEVLWDSAEPLTPGDVHAVLDQERTVSYTTVMTVLTRLWDKGRVDRHRSGRAYAYQPLLTRDEHTAEQMCQLLDDVYDSTGALTQFVAGLRPAQQSQLKRLLGGKKKK